MGKWLLLDRDGTLNKDMGYIGTTDRVNILPEAITGLTLFRELGYRFAVVSNQSGVRRGIVTTEQVDEINEIIRRRLLDECITVERFYYCPHLPEDNCECRKPKPGLLLRAIRDLRIDATAAYMVGDKLSDVEAGQAASVRSVLLGRQESLQAASTYIQARDLFAFARIVQKCEEGGYEECS